MDDAALQHWTAVAERAHAATLELFVRPLERARIEQRPDAMLYVSGFYVPTFNGAIALGSPPQNRELIDSTRNFCAPAHIPWGISASEGWVHAHQSELRRQGFREVDREPALVYPNLEQPPPAAPPGLTIRSARTATELGTFLVTLAQGSGIPSGALMPTLRPKVLAAYAAAPNAAWFVGFADGQPVATAMHLRVEGLAYVSMVSTLRGYRRRGIGAAMTWRAALSGGSYGCTVAGLRASKMGYPLYRKMGFLPTTVYPTMHAGGPGALRLLAEIFRVLLRTAIGSGRVGRYRRATPDAFGS